MPKKNRRKKTNENDEPDDADYLSESHTIATLNSVADGSSLEDDWGIDDDLVQEPDDNALQAAETRRQKLVDVLATTADFAGEKRSTKREALLKSWFRALTLYATQDYDPVEERLEDLLQGCRFSLRQGSPSEQYAACRVLEATAVLVGDEGWYEQVQLHLKRVLESSHRAVPVRVAALRALGMAVFVGVDDDEITEQVLDLCESLAQTEYRGHEVPSGLRTTALEVWSLLATTIHELYVSGKDDVSTGRGLLLLPLLLQCLEQGEDLTLRSAAGECVAWIHTARLSLGMAHDDEDGDVNTTQRKYAQGGWEGSEWEGMMAEIEQLMDEFSNQSGHYLSKRTKKELRSTFREYLATVQDNEEPDHVVQFRGGSLELTSWRDIIALNFIRRCLQSGFQIQLLTNPTLQAIFGANAQALNAQAGYSQLEKRLLLSKTSEANKVKDMDLHKKRKVRHNVKNHFLTVDGEDI